MHRGMWDPCTPRGLSFSCGLRSPLSLPLWRQPPFVCYARRLFPPKAAASSSEPAASDSGFGIVSASEYSDGSILFRFGDVREIVENNQILDKEAELEAESDATNASTSQEVESVDCEPRQMGSTAAEVKSFQMSFQRQESGDSGNKMIDVLPGVSDLESSCEATKDGRGSSQEMISYKILIPGSNSEMLNAAESDGSHDDAEVTTNVAFPDLYMDSSEKTLQEHSSGDSAVHLSSPTSNSFSELQGDIAINDCKLDSSTDVVLLSEVWQDALSEVRLDHRGQIKEDTIIDPADDNIIHATEVVHDLSLSTVEPVHGKESSQKATDISSTTKDKETDAEECASGSIANSGAHAVKVEPEFSLLTEESILSEEPSPLAMDLISPVSIESLKIDGKAASSNLEVNVSKDDPSTSYASELQQISDAYNGREEILKTNLVLCSGTASIPHPYKEFAGGEDFQFLTANWIGIADGAREWSLEGTGAGLYALELLKNCERIVSEGTSGHLIDPVDVMCKAAARSESSGLCTSLIAYFDGQVLHVANLGNSGVLVLRNGIVCERSFPAVHEFNFPFQLVRSDDPSELLEAYRFRLEEGDIVVTATDGLFDNLYTQELASIVTKSLQTSSKPREMAEMLAVRAHELGQMASGRSPFADAAQAAGYVGFTGGRLDDVTVIVSLVQSKSSRLQ